MECITEEGKKKIQEIKKSKSYICNKGFEEEVINEMLDILRNDEKIQEFSKQTMKKIIIGEI